LKIELILIFANYHFKEIKMTLQETLTFYWKVSSEENSDYLEFYIDDVRQDRISGELGWEKKTYDVNGTGTYTLKWRYVKDGSGDDGDDCGWLDFVQWTGPSPAQDPANWEKITYKYDQSGRRIEKTVDGYSTRYLHDGGNVIAEYDGNNNLLRKYIHGPRVDEPVCMIDVADSNAVYYYHYDGLGSVVALSDSNGGSVQTYDYSVYGQVAAEDPNFLANPYMFTGRRFDFETGLYYYRARYYNPYIGRFLQTDPIGYGAGMNLYAYCGNNPIGLVDPLGLYGTCGYPSSCDPCWAEATGRIMVLPYKLNPTKLSRLKGLSQFLSVYKKVMGWKGNIGVATKIWKGKYLQAMADVCDPVGTMVNTYMTAMKAVADSYGLGAINKNGWKAFIEIQWYRWKTDSLGRQVVDERGVAVEEKVGDPYWKEVVGLTGWVYGERYYFTFRQAHDASSFGIRFWACYMAGRTLHDSYFEQPNIGGLKDIYGGTYYWKGDEVPEFTPPEFTTP